jgi:nitroreductase
MISESIHIKEAQTKHPVLDVIRQRWSARSFSHQPVSQDTLEQLIEAASWAPSSMNDQPWTYVYAHRGTEAFNTMLACLNTGNQPWAANAAVLVISLANKVHHNGHPNKHHMHDTGAANMLMMIEAVAHGIYGHVMGGFHHDKTLEAFNVTDQQDVVAFIALGYLDDPAKLEEPFHTRELTTRKRKPLSETAIPAVNALRRV